MKTCVVKGGCSDFGGPCPSCRDVTNNIEAGDKVRLHPDQYGKVSGLSSGTVYTVQSTDVPFIRLKGVGVGGYFRDRFELVEKAKPVPTLDLKKPIQTRDGRSVRIVCTDAPAPNTIIAITFSGQLDWVGRYLPSGRLSPEIERPDDLVNVPPKPRTATSEVYLYVTKGGKVKLVAADQGSPKPSKIIGKTTVTITEGEGLTG